MEQGIEFEKVENARMLSSNSEFTIILFLGFISLNQSLKLIKGCALPPIWTFPPWAVPFLMSFCWWAFCVVGGINAVNSDGWRSWCGLVGGLGAAWLEVLARLGWRPYACRISWFIFICVVELRRAERKEERRYWRLKERKKCFKVGPCVCFCCRFGKFGL